MSPRRIATVVAVLAAGSSAAWGLIEIGRPAGRAPVAPIVMRDSGTDPGTNLDEERGDPEPGEAGGSGGAEPPPAPPPPPAGGEDAGGDDGGDDADD